MDEAELKGNIIALIEGKHSKKNHLPSLEDIKDGLLKMILFTNLENVKINGKSYRSVAILKLTTGQHFNIRNINNLQQANLNLLYQEAKQNNFKIDLQ